MTIKQSIIFVIVITITLFIAMQVVKANGQNQNKYMNEDEIQIILGYCYLHADRPNPVLDLVDKGLVSANFAGDTCKSVKQGNEEAQKIRDEVNSASLAYAKCDENQTATYADCMSIIRKYCNDPLYYENFGLC